MRNGEIASYSKKMEDRGEGGGGKGGGGEGKEEEKQEDTCKVKEFVPHWSMAYIPSLGT